MLTTLVNARFGPFVALLLTAAVMASVCAALEDNVECRWWYDEARATRRFFVIAGVLGLASLAQGVGDSVAWTVAVVVAFSVDFGLAIRQLDATRG